MFTRGFFSFFSECVSYAPQNNSHLSPGDVTEKAVVKLADGEESCFVYFIPVTKQW